jgi:hypothetical protein
MLIMAARPSRAMERIMASFLPEAVALHTDEGVFRQLDLREHEVDVWAVAQPEGLRPARLAGGHAWCVPLDRSWSQ